MTIKHPLSPKRRNAFHGDQILIATKSAGDIQAGEEFAPLYAGNNGYTVIRQTNGEKVTICA